MCEIKSKALRNLGYIKRVLGNNTPMFTKRLLYVTLVRSIVMYCSQLWSPYKKCDLIYIEQIQRQATRCICNYIDITYSERLERCNLLPLCYVREIQDLLFFYNLINSRLNVRIENYFTIDNSVRRGRSIHKNLFIVHKRYNTEKCYSYYTNRILKMWLSLPEIIQNINPPPRITSKPLLFKKALTDYYKNKTVQIYDVKNTCTWITTCRCIQCRH